MPLEATQVLPWLALAVSSLVAIRTEWRSRQSTDDSLRIKVEGDVKALRQIMEAQEQLWRQQFMSHHDDILILKEQIKPLVVALGSKAMSLFHQPHNEYGLDQIMERFDADTTDFKWNITDAELDQLIRGMGIWYRRMQEGSVDEDQFKTFVSGVTLALLRSLKQVRRIERERAAREVTEQSQRDELTRYIEDRKASLGQEPWSLTAALKRWWCG